MQAHTIDQLSTLIEGEVFTDETHRSIYSTDASNYQIKPSAVVLPKSVEDLKHIVHFSRIHSLPITMRGGGTSLAGQTVGHGLIVDCSKYLNDVLQIHPQEKWARVQPGVVRDQLNKAAQSYQLQFAPDPATSSRATIAGMIANNSSGTKSIRYGKTVDHIQSITLLTIDGDILELSAYDAEDLQQLREQGNKEYDFYAKIQTLIKDNEQEITSKFPKVMRRASGYLLDELLDKTNFNLSKLISASEGTLGIILEAKINLVPIPAFRQLCLLHYQSMYEALDSVQHLTKFQPSAIELIDQTVINLAQNNAETQRDCHVLVGDPTAVLIVDFNEDDNQVLENKIKKTLEYINERGLVYASPILPNGPDYDSAWAIRKKGLGILLSTTEERKPVAFIEDSCVPLEHLADYVQSIQEFCDEEGCDLAIYAHASVGVIHLRPFLDLKRQDEINRMKRISEFAFQKVVEFGGSWSGEHGDGLSRSFRNQDFFGDTVYSLFKEIKRIFDPYNLLNPGKIVDAPPMDEDLRYGTTYHDQEIDTVFRYQKLSSFRSAVHLCSGIGACRKIDDGSMCPSYMVTENEIDSTRGRANLLRMVMSNQVLHGDFTAQEVQDALSLCVSCKACKTECPSNVDMAKLKSEVANMVHKKHGVSLKDKLIRNSSTMAKQLSGPTAGLVNRIQKTKLFRQNLERLTGLDSRRQLPGYASTSLTAWFRNRKTPISTNPSPKKVAIFADTYINYHEPNIGQHGVKLLEHLGLDVQLIDLGCCQRPRISNGFLNEAKNAGQVLWSKLATIVKQEIPVLVFEPSCASALLDDLPDLVEEMDNAQLQSFVMPVEDFLLDHLQKNGQSDILELANQNIFIHNHCHQKALFSPEHVIKMFQTIDPNVQITLVDSGCCGMAGAFGYEKVHYDISKQMAERKLMPAIRDFDHSGAIVANGFSCRHQISDFSGRKAQHFIELINIKL